MFDFSAFFAQYGNLFLQGTVDTLIMTCVATILAYVIGIPLGILLVVTSPNGLRPNRIVSTIVGWIVNIGRSVPFIILLVALIPFTRFIVGTSLGVPGAVVPLVVTAAPFAARMVEQSLEETDSGLVEAAQSFGASTWQIVWKVYLKETLPSLVRAESPRTNRCISSSAETPNGSREMFFTDSVTRPSDKAASRYSRVPGIAYLQALPKRLSSTRHSSWPSASTAQFSGTVNTGVSCALISRCSYSPRHWRKSSSTAQGASAA